MVSCNRQMGIRFGALAPAISAQLRAQKFEADNVELLDKLKHSLDMIRVHGLLADSEYDRVCKRFVKLIMGAARRIPYDG